MSVRARDAQTRCADSRGRGHYAIGSLLSQRAIEQLHVVTLSSRLRRTGICVDCS